MIVSTHQLMHLQRMLDHVSVVLQEGESQLLITIPPSSQPLQNPHVIRVVQLGPAAAVCPSNRYAYHQSGLWSALSR